MQQDTITLEQGTLSPEAVEPLKTSKSQHPYQVLRMLPKDATPSQQDSAIQAVFKPKPIRYSSCPDTLHIPGHGIGKSIREVSLPKYYKESFFSKDTLFHPELEGGRYGMAGDPVPYTIKSDDTISILLIVCFVIIMVSFSKSKQFFFRQAKNFLYISHRESSISETSSEIRFQMFMTVHASLLWSLLEYFYATHYISDTFILESQYHLIAIFFGMNLTYYLMRSALYSIVDIVFFNKKKNIQWQKNLLFLTTLESVLLFPAVMLQSYFDISIESITIYSVSIVILVKLLTFYKSFAIFFRQNRLFFQIILYFCALEAVPMAAFIGALAITGNYLKIIF